MYITHSIQREPGANQPKTNVRPFERPKPRHPARSGWSNLGDRSLVAEFEKQPVSIRQYGSLARLWSADEIADRLRRSRVHRFDVHAIQTRNISGFPPLLFGVQQPPLPKG